MIENLRTLSLKSKKVNYSSAAASLLPLLTCKKTEPVPTLHLKEKVQKINSDMFQQSTITKKIIGRRPTLTIEKINSYRFLKKQSSRGQVKVNKTIIETVDQNQLDEKRTNKTSSAMRKFRLKKVTDKYIRPETTDNYCKSMFELNHNFSQKVIKSAAPTDILYLNPNIKSSQQIAILNIDNFHETSRSWKTNQTKDNKLTSQFKHILQSISSKFSIILKSQQMQAKAQNVLSQLISDDIQILAWINVSNKSKSTNTNQLYNLSDVFQTIGILCKIWIFEESAHAKPNIKDIMLPVFEQSADVSLILYQKQNKKKLVAITSQQLRNLIKLNTAQLAAFHLESIINPHPPIIEHHIQLSDDKNYKQYDISQFRNKLIQYMKILKTQKKCSNNTTNSIHYLVGDLIKRNYQIFENVFESEKQTVSHSQKLFEEKDKEECKYKIQILQL